ncbi:MAG: DUF6111 family protein [Hyphomicrobiaceae bacterium]
MIRIVIENLLLFLLPTILYVAYLMVMRRGQPSGSALQVIDDAPLLWLFTAGAVLAIGALAYFGSFERAEPGRPYIPPSYQDGKIVPGRHE